MNIELHLHDSLEYHSLIKEFSIDHKTIREYKINYHQIFLDESSKYFYEIKNIYQYHYNWTWNMCNLFLIISFLLFPQAFLTTVFLSMDVSRKIMHTSLITKFHSIFYFTPSYMPSNYAFLSVRKSHLTIKWKGCAK